MIKIQALMTVSDFSGCFFLGIIFWKEASLFYGGLFFRWGNFIFKGRPIVGGGGTIGFDNVGEGRVGGVRKKW